MGLHLHAAKEAQVIGADIEIKARRGVGYYLEVRT
jgi:hypothetical protein